MKCEYCNETMIDSLERAQGFCWSCAEEIHEREAEFEKEMEQREWEERNNGNDYN